VALSKLAANSFDLTDNYAFTGTTTGATSTQKLFLIKNIDASSDSTISFVNGSSSVVLDNTYKTYLFRFVNLHPANNGPNMRFQGSVNTGSSYGVNITSTNIVVRNFENDSSTTFQYDTGGDLAQSTSFQPFTCGPENQNDSGVGGDLYLFNPSSTTFVKHFLGVTNGIGADAHSQQQLFAGYFNTTSAIDAIQFNTSSGDIDAGRFSLYGIK